MRVYWFLGEGGEPFREAYPSAYQPPPFSSKVHRDNIFLALEEQQGHLMCLVPRGTIFSVIVPLRHSNS